MDDGRRPILAAHDNSGTGRVQLISSGGNLARCDQRLSSTTVVEANPFITAVDLWWIIKYQSKRKKIADL